MDDRTSQYIGGTSDFIGYAKTHILKINEGIKNMAKTVENMDSRTQTKAKTKEELLNDLRDVSSELSNIAKKTIDLNNHIASLAQHNQDGKQTN